MSTNIWLKSIRLKNYRCFHKLSVDLDGQLTVLVGQNGTGKTAVLDAIAVSLSAFAGAFHHGTRVGIKRDDVLLKVMNSEIPEMEPQYPCSLACKGEILGQNILWERWMNTPYSKNTFKEAKPVIDIGKQLQSAIADDNKNPDVVLPVIAYYGTGRLWNQKKATEKEISDTGFFYSRTSGYFDCLEPASSYKYFVDWFRFISRMHTDMRDQNIQRFGERALQMETPFQALLNGVMAAVDVCLAHTGWQGLRYSSIHQAPVVEHRGAGMLEVRQLSDGIRNMIAMVADIAFRSVRLNTQFKERAPFLSPGIVLIDEVDMHLHPEWQQRVLGLLRRAFPKIQFVVATHSPQVLSTIESRHIRLLTVNVEGEPVAAVPAAESYARSNADVLEAVMHTSPIPAVKESGKLAKYRQLVEQGELHTSEIKHLQQKLEQALGRDHPELIHLEKVKLRRELLK